MFVLCIFKIALSSLLHLARMYKQQFYNKVLFTWVSVRLKLLLPLLIYSDRIIARQFWSSLILILLSPCQNWLLLLFYFSDLPVRTVAVPLLAKFLAKLQARFWAKLSGKFPVNCNETYVHENATFNSYTYYRILIDWVCSAYSHVGAFSELWKIEQDIFLSSEVDEFITCAAKFFIYFAQMNLFTQGLSEHKALLGFYRYLYELGNDQSYFEKHWLS